MAIERKYERDIDLLLAEEFLVSPKFADWFLTRTQFRGASAKVLDVFVSQSDFDGESDLIVLFGGGGGQRFALFIEDKIDARFMPAQRERYDRRAETGRARGEFAEFEVILCAPRAFFESAAEATLFKTQISYEQIAEAIALLDGTSRGAYRAKFLSSAAQRKANIWKHVDDALTNDFWEKAYRIAMTDFPILEMKEPRYSKGAAWIWFRPRDFPGVPKQVRVEMKGQQGHIDLTFPRTDGASFAKIVTHILSVNMIASGAGKAAVVRLRVPSFRIADGLEANLPKIRTAFEAAGTLIEFYRTHRTELDDAAAEATLW